MLAKKLALPTELMLKNRLESSSGKKVSRVLVICKFLILRINGGEGGIRTRHTASLDAAFRVSVTKK